MADMEKLRIQLKNINFQLLFFDFPNNNYILRVDKKRLQLVFLCLFRNAVQFSKKDGNIMVLVEFCKISGHDKIRLTVVDNGLGIAQNKKIMMFQLINSFKKS